MFGGGSQQLDADDGFSDAAVVGLHKHVSSDADAELIFVERNAEWWWVLSLFDCSSVNLLFNSYVGSTVMLSFKGAAAETQTA